MLNVALQILFGKVMHVLLFLLVPMTLISTERIVFTVRAVKYLIQMIVFVLRELAGMNSNAF